MGVEHQTFSGITPDTERAPQDLERVSNRQILDEIESMTTEMIPQAEAASTAVTAAMDQQLPAPEPVPVAVEEIASEAATEQAVVLDGTSTTPDLVALERLPAKIAELNGMAADLRVQIAPLPDDDSLKRRFLKVIGTDHIEQVVTGRGDFEVGSAELARVVDQYISVLAKGEEPIQRRLDQMSSASAEQPTMIVNEVEFKESDHRFKYRNLLRQQAMLERALETKDMDEREGILVDMDIVDIRAAQTLLPRLEQVIDRYQTSHPIVIGTTLEQLNDSKERAAEEVYYERALQAAGLERTSQAADEFATDQQQARQQKLNKIMALERANAVVELDQQIVEGVPGSKKFAEPLNTKRTEWVKQKTQRINEKLPRTERAPGEWKLAEQSYMTVDPKTIDDPTELTKNYKNLLRTRVDLRDDPPKRGSNPFKAQFWNIGARRKQWKNDIASINAKEREFRSRLLEIAPDTMVNTPRG